MTASMTQRTAHDRSSETEAQPASRSLPGGTRFGLAAARADANGMNGLRAVQR